MSHLTQPIISDLQKLFLTPSPNHLYTPRPSRPTMRGVGHRHERGTGCGGRGSASGACRGRRAGLSSVSERSAQTTGADIRMNPSAKPAAPGEASWRSREGCVRQNRVVLAPVAGVKPAEERRPNRVRTILQSAGDGGKTNSSPGRARHKP